MIELSANVMMQSAEIAGKRLLVAVVDDDAAVCSSLKFALELEGFAVRIFGSGAELLQAGDVDAWNCLVVDHKMPEMSGLELIEKLQGRNVLTPAILLVSNPNAAISARAARGAIPVVEKPLFGNALVERIREACARNPG
jgi:two-component system, LuxR family, response regulator FixJ